MQLPYNTVDSTCSAKPTKPSDNWSSANPSDDWIPFNILHKYNVELAFQDTETFFGETPLPAPSVPDDLLTAANSSETTDDVSYSILAQMADTRIPDAKGKLHIIDFAVALFQALGYSRRPYIVRTRAELGALVDGDMKKIMIDVCLTGRNIHTVALLVQGDASLGPDPQEELLAGAIAAFRINDAKRVQLEPLESMVIPAIIMDGPSPRFYKIPVTRELSQCVKLGQFPPTPTVILGHVPDIPHPILRQSRGMLDIDNRRAFLRCFEAFKKFIL